MTIRIEKDAHGRDVIWSEVGGKAVPLPAENIYIRAIDGHVFTAIPALPGLERLYPYQPEMVDFWLRERGAGIEPFIFAGEPRRPPETDTTD